MKRAQKLFTLADYPEREAEIPRLHSESWPAFIQADPVAIRYWGLLFSTFAEYQYLLCDEQDRLVAVGHSIPLTWNGSSDDLPQGWDAALSQGFHDRDQGVTVNTLCALSIVIAPGNQGQGLGELMVKAMKDIALINGLDQIIAPVRPSLKSLYPLIPLERYLRWQRPDGTPFDPWIRLHQQLGARTLTLASPSMTVTGTVAQWEHWTGLRFPESGRYPIAGALEPVMIDCEQDYGRYEESNVWMSYEGLLRDASGCAGADQEARGAQPPSRLSAS